MEPHAESAWAASPLFRFRPDMMKMPVVVKVCKPALAAWIPGLGAMDLKQSSLLHAAGLQKCVGLWSVGKHGAGQSAAMSLLQCRLCTQYPRAGCKRAAWTGTA